MAEKDEKKGYPQSTVPTLPAEEVFGSQNGVSAGTGREIDRATKDGLEKESDEDYREITKNIVDITERELRNHKDAKNPLRERLSEFIMGLLSVQFAALLLILFFNHTVSDAVIEVYIVSVFVETLAGLIIMIRFAFDSTQEVKLIQILNAIVINFQKYRDK